MQKHSYMSSTYVASPKRVVRTSDHVSCNLEKGWMNKTSVLGD